VNPHSTTPPDAHAGTAAQDARALTVDVALVGAGPVGLFGAYYAGFRGLRVAVIDSLPEVGGQVSAMYPEKQLYDIAGFPAVIGRTLISNLLAQADRYHPQYLLAQEARSLDRIPAAVAGEPDRLVVTTSAGSQVTAGAVVLTGGIGTFTPRQLAAGTRYEGRGLAYFVPDPQDCANADVVIVGGGDSAFDWAHLLHPIARSVTLVHRRDTFRAHPASVAAARDAGIDIITRAHVQQVLGNGTVQAVELTVEGTGQPRRLLCDRLIAALGFTANLGPLRSWGLALAHNRHVIVDPAMRTNIDGVFAAGDIAEHHGKVRLIAVGFGEVATAVNHAATYIDPTLDIFPGHSTDADHPMPTAAA
jgi:ferredoxin/flavodoxin---NADP+ reductase